MSNPLNTSNDRSRAILGDIFKGMPGVAHNILIYSDFKSLLNSMWTSQELRTNSLMAAGSFFSAQNSPFLDYLSSRLTAESDKALLTEKDAYPNAKEFHSSMLLIKELYMRTLTAPPLSQELSLPDRFFIPSKGFPNIPAEERFYNLLQRTALEQHSDHFGQVCYLTKEANTHLTAGHKQRGFYILDMATTRANIIGDDRHKLYCLTKISESFLKAGNENRALEVFNTTVAIAETVEGGPFVKCHELMTIARECYGGTFKDRPLFKQAVFASLERCIPFASTFEDPWEKVCYLTGISESFSVGQNSTKASQILEGAVLIANTIGDPETKIKSLEKIADAFARGGNERRAREVFWHAKILETFAFFLNLLR